MITQWQGLAGISFALALTATVGAATITQTGDLHYDTQAEFDNEWRTTKANGSGIGGMAVENDVDDGNYVRMGNTGSGSMSRVYDLDPENSSTQTVFDVSDSSAPFVAYTDFRFVGASSGGEDARAVLAAVSLDGNSSYAASWYTNQGDTGNGRLRFEDYNFNTGDRNASLTIGAADSVNLDKDKWYRLIFTMTRQDDTAGSPVDLEVSLYAIDGGDKGGETGSLLGSLSHANANNLGDQVQFGLRAGTRSQYELRLDNFGAYVPEPATGLLLGLAVVPVLCRSRRRSAGG